MGLSMSIYWLYSGSLSFDKLDILALCDLYIWRIIQESSTSCYMLVVRRDRGWVSLSECIVRSHSNRLLCPDTHVMIIHYSGFMRVRFMGRYIIFIANVEYSDFRIQCIITASRQARKDGYTTENEMRNCNIRAATRERWNGTLTVDLSWLHRGWSPEVWVPGAGWVCSSPPAVPPWRASGQLWLPSRRRVLLGGGRYPPPIWTPAEERMDTLVCGVIGHANITPPLRRSQRGEPKTQGNVHKEWMLLEGANVNTCRRVSRDHSSTLFLPPPVEADILNTQVLHPRPILPHKQVNIGTVFDKHTNSSMCLLPRLCAPREQPTPSLRSALQYTSLALFARFFTPWHRSLRIMAFNPPPVTNSLAGGLSRASLRHQDKRVDLCDCDSYGLRQPYWGSTDSF